jgi:formylglycine-generating enzyme required for sulfatase activity
MKPSPQLEACILFALLWVFADVGAGLSQPAKPEDGPLEMKFAPLPKGTFYMGGGGGKAGKKTEIKEDFEIAVHTVTQAQWQAVMGNNPSWFSRAGGGKDAVKDIKDEELKLFPIESVSWDDVQEFIKKLNEKEAGRGYAYRLPSEAEWEYACRGGATSEEEGSYDFYFAKPTNDLSSTQANIIGNEPFGKAEKGPDLGRPTKVGSYAPNKLGLYDMHGNVWQWCADPYGTPQRPGRVLRGGGWGSGGQFCRASERSWSAPSVPSRYVGFRVARVPDR